MKPIKNITKTVCTVCAPELFKRYCMLYKNGEYGGLEWTFAHTRNCLAADKHQKVLRRVEPTVVCCMDEKGRNRWQFTLEDCDEASG